MRSNHDDGFTLVEILVTMAIIAVIAALAIPGLLRSRASANEASAIASVRAINGAEAAYAASCGGGGYAATLAALGLAPPGGIPFVENDIQAGSKSGYLLALSAEAGSNVVLPAASTCNSAATDTVTDYHTSAVPISPGFTGQRSFASNQQGAIYQDLTGAAIANPVPPGTTPLD